MLVSIVFVNLPIMYDFCNLIHYLHFNIQMAPHTPPDNLKCINPESELNYTIEMASIKNSIVCTIWIHHHFYTSYEVHLNFLIFPCLSFFKAREDSYT